MQGGDGTLKPRAKPLHTSRTEEACCRAGGGVSISRLFQPEYSSTYAPSLAAIGIDSETVTRLNAFSGELFNNVGLPELGSSLKDYRDVLVASLLMYYNQVKAALGNESPIIKTMCLAAINVGSDIATMAQWGETQ